MCVCVKERERESARARERERGWVGACEMKEWSYNGMMYIYDNCGATLPRTTAD